MSYGINSVWEGAELFHPEYEGKDFDEIEKICDKEEKEALAKEGIVLAANHLDGYKYFKPKMIGGGFTQMKQPWEIKVELDSKFSKVKCTAANWTHKTVDFKVGHGIAYITLNDASTNNALTDDTLQALSDCVAELKPRRDIRLVILKAEGKMFCSGNHPKTYQENVNKNANDNKNEVITLSKFFDSFKKLPTFTVALCQGSVMGSGMGLVCACDMIVALKSAHFQCSDCKLGVVPAAALPFIVRKLGMSCSKRFLCLAENWNGTTAYSSGLIQELVDTPDELTAFVTKISEQMSLCGPVSVAGSKVLVANVGGQPMTSDLIGYTADELARVRSGTEADSGMKAILSRQKPYWAEDPIQP